MASLWSSAFHQGMLYSNVGKKMGEKGVFLHIEVGFFLKFFCVFCVILPVLFFCVCAKNEVFS